MEFRGDGYIGESYGESEEYKTFEDAMVIRNSSEKSEDTSFAESISEEDIERVYVEYVKDNI